MTTRITRNITKEEIIKVCENSESMSSACQQLGLHFNTFKKYALKFNCYCPNQSGKGINKPSGHKYLLQDILDGKYPQYGTSKLNKRLIDENILEAKCMKCGFTHWNGEKISLELHHIDGNRHNHSLNNLRLLCPNCHAQTDTYRGSKLKGKTFIKVV